LSWAASGPLPPAPGGDLSGRRMKLAPNKCLLGVISGHGMVDPNVR
jgi:hypothetical protein